MVALFPLTFISFSIEAVTGLEFIFNSLIVLISGKVTVPVVLAGILTSYTKVLFSNFHQEMILPYIELNSTFALVNPPPTWGVNIICLYPGFCSSIFNPATY